MPVQPFGKADPYYDALRVMSNQNIQGAALGDTGGVGGALENKIYLWPTDGTTITTYDPDEAGLIAALAAAVNGDTVWLPSMLITLTQPITVPNGVCLRGMDWNAELSFSGFDNVALLVSNSAIVYNFSLTFVATGTDAIGVQAQGDNAIIDHLHIVVSGASTSNIGIGSVAAQANELWFATAANVVWSNTIIFSGTSTINWNKMASYAQATPLAKFVILQDGSGLFIQQIDPGNGSKNTIYKCTNLAAVRANPTTTPTWISILVAGDVITTNLGTATVPASYLMDRYGANLIISFSDGGHSIYGEYNGTAWAWYEVAVGWQSFGKDTLVVRSFVGPADQDFRLHDKTGTILGITGVHSATAGVSPVWRSSVNSDYYAVRWYFNGSPYNETIGSFIFKFNTTFDPSANLGPELAGATASNADGCSVRGALDGLSLCVVNQYDGKFYISEDRTTATNPATWLNGIVEESSLIGGSNLVWMPYSQTNGLSVIQTSVDRGVTWTTRTNDYWSAIQGAGNFLMLNMYTVF